jgi:hypothetical protein
VANPLLCGMACSLGGLVVWQEEVLDFVEKEGCMYWEVRLCSYAAPSHPAGQIAPHDSRVSGLMCVASKHHHPGAFSRAQSRRVDYTTRCARAWGGCS